jgi:hypothetical protein
LLPLLRPPGRVCSAACLLGALALAPWRLAVRSQQAGGRVLVGLAGGALPRPRLGAPPLLHRRRREAQLLSSAGAARTPAALALLAAGAAPNPAPATAAAAPALASPRRSGCCASRPASCRLPALLPQVRRLPLAALAPWPGRAAGGGRAASSGRRRCSRAARLRCRQPSQAGPALCRPDCLPLAASPRSRARSNEDLEHSTMLEEEVKRSDR